VNGYLLDTNVPSEFSRDRPEPRVVRWLKAQPPTMLFLSAVTIGEIRKGLTVLPHGRRRAARLPKPYQTLIHELLEEAAARAA
jgi:predicted nucleic acid-binding protein